MYLEAPESERWSKKVLNDMIGDPLNPTPQPKRAGYTSLCIVRSSMMARRVVQHVSGMRKYTHQNAGHDSRISHREELRA